jgi:hypothetical protein
VDSCPFSFRVNSPDPFWSDSKLDLSEEYVLRLACMPPQKPGHSSPNWCHIAQITRTSFLLWLHHVRFRFRLNFSTGGTLVVRWTGLQRLLRDLTRSALQNGGGIVQSASNPLFYHSSYICVFFDFSQPKPTCMRILLTAITASSNRPGGFDTSRLLFGPRC